MPQMDLFMANNQRRVENFKLISARLKQENAAAAEVAAKQAEASLKVEPKADSKVGMPKAIAVVFPSYLICLAIRKGILRIP